MQGQDPQNHFALMMSLLHSLYALLLWILLKNVPPQTSSSMGYTTQMENISELAEFAN